ncbi:MAG: DUF4838 domain-containing protein, partial [Lentisphaerae bacterium]|nr:DUF4838 domain-containing protein [Lentisphaerota bacterium]
KAMATIVVPDDAGDVATRAAEWIRAYVQKVSGAELPVLPEGRCPAGNLISVGHTTLAAAAGVDAADLQYDGCRLVAKGNVLYLLGRDTLTTLQRERWQDGERRASKVQCGAQGTCKAATTFLERFCGVRWFLPAPDGEFVPPSADVAVPDDTDIVYTPPFAFLHGRYVYGSQLGPAAIANNNRTAIKLCTFGGHSWPTWVPPAIYYKDHPEYFALIDGKRTDSKSGHLCTSNPEVRQILLKETRTLFDAGFEWVQLGQSDGYLRCQCAACEKLDTYRGRANKLGLTTDEWLYTYLKDNPCERIHDVHKWIADECMVSHPDKTVHLLVYSTSVTPSKAFDAWPTNTVGEVCDVDPRIIGGWEGKLRAKTTYMCWYLIAWRGVGFGVMVTPRQIAERIGYLRKHNFIGIYLCGGGANWGLQGPTYYTMGKMCEDSTLSYKDLTAEYCRGIYGAAAEEMIDFFRQLYVPESDILMYNYFNRDKAVAGDRLTSMYPPELLNTLDGILCAAEAKVDTDRARNWVRLTRDHFDFVKLCCNVMAAYGECQVRSTHENVLKIEHHLDAFEAYREKIVSYSEEHTDRWFPAYMKLYNFLTAEGSYDTARRRRQRHAPERIEEGFRGTPVGYRQFLIREPFTWDLRMIKDRPFLRQVATPDGDDYRRQLKSATAVAEQLASNPSFEDAGEGSTPTGWVFWVKHGVGTMALVQGEGRTGTASVLYEGMRRGGVNRKLVVPPGRYVAVAFVRTPQPLNSRAKVTISVSPRAEDGAVLRGAVLERSTQGLPAGGWVALSAYGDIPAKADGKDVAKVLIIVTVDNMAPGERLYVDDFQLLRLND